MIDYNEIVDEICTNTDVKKEDVFFFEGTPLEPFCNQIFQYSQTYLNDKNGLGFFKITPARFFINNDTRVNAWAWVNKDYSLISFNIGTIQKLKSIFYDSEDYFENDEILGDYKELNNLFKDSGSSILETMYHTGLMFLLYHESGHLIQKSDRVYDLINENVSSTKKFNIYNHQIEVDSDIFASINLGNHAIDIWSRLPKENQTKENLEKVISVIVSGIGIYRLFYLQLGNKEMYYEENTHPHIIIRCIIIIERIIDYSMFEINQIDKIEIKENIDFNRVANSAYDIMEYLTSKIFKEDIFNNFMKTANKHSKEIIEYAKRLTALVANDKNMADSKWKELTKK